MISLYDMTELLESKLVMFLLGFTTASAIFILITYLVKSIYDDILEKCQNDNTLNGYQPTDKLDTSNPPKDL